MILCFGANLDGIVQQATDCELYVLNERSQTKARVPPFSVKLLGVMARGNHVDTPRYLFSVMHPGSQCIRMQQGSEHDSEGGGHRVHTVSEWGEDVITPVHA